MTTSWRCLSPAWRRREYDTERYSAGRSISTKGPRNKHHPSHNAAGHRQWRGIGTLQGTCDTERLSILMIHKSPISAQASADSRIDLGAMGRTLAVTALVPKPQFRGDGGVMGPYRPRWRRR